MHLCTRTVTLPVRVGKVTKYLDIDMPWTPEFTQKRIADKLHRQQSLHDCNPSLHKYSSELTA